MRVGDRFIVLIEENGREYTISEIDVLSVIISWESSGNQISTTYPKEDIKNYFLNGIWVYSKKQIRKDKLNKIYNLKI